MIPAEKITLINVLATLQYPFRKLTAFVGRQQAIGFEIVKDGTFNGRTYAGDLITMTLLEEPYGNVCQKRAFKDQLVVSAEGSPYKWIQDVEGNSHPIFICTINELPSDELTDLIKGNIK